MNKDIEMKASAKYTIKTPELLLQKQDPQQEGEAVIIKWDVLSREDIEPKLIGEVRVFGPAKLGVVSMDFSVEKPYRDKGYATQAVKLIVQWIFSQKDIYEVTAGVMNDNDAGIIVLEKAGFVYRSSERIGETMEKKEFYSIMKAKSAWTGLYLILGVFFGLALGVLLSSMIVGFVIGVVAAVLAGCVMDRKIEQHREEVTGKVNDKHGFVKSDS